MNVSSFPILRSIFMRVLFLIFLCLWAAVCVQAGPQWAEIIDPDGFTNVRAGKSAESAVVTQIQMGQRFRVEPSGENWWAVTAPDGRSGYMHRSRVHLLGALEAESSTPDLRTAIIYDPDGFTFIRSGKSKDTPVIGRVEAGSQFTAEPSRESWWKVVAADGTSGYMHKSCIQLLDSGTSLAQTPPLPFAPIQARPTPVRARRPDSADPSDPDISDVVSPHLYDEGDLVLCIDPHIHTNTIRHLATEPSGRLALTVSTDKTARLWEISTGHSLHVFRFPSGPGLQGILYAGALSPNAEVAAVAGYTGPDQIGIYLCDTMFRNQRRIDGLRDVPFNLAFSPGGHFLAGVGG